MKEEFIPYNLAVALKELGFDEPCLLFIQYSSGTDVFDGSKFKNSIWLGNGYDAEIDDKKIKYKFPKHSEQSYGTLGIPLYQQVFRWFREKYGLTCWIDKRKDFANPHNWYIISDESDDTNLLDYDFSYETHQEAELECLKKLIEIVKTK